MSEMWERGEHPGQAEVHEPLTEFDGPAGVTPDDDYIEVVYEVTVMVHVDDPVPEEDRIKQAIYQCDPHIRTPDAVDVQLM